MRSSIIMDVKGEIFVRGGRHGRNHGFQRGSGRGAHYNDSGKGSQPMQFSSDQLGVPSNEEPPDEIEPTAKLEDTSSPLTGASPPNNLERLRKAAEENAALQEKISAQIKDLEARRIALIKESEENLASTEEEDEIYIKEKLSIEDTIKKLNSHKRELEVQKRGFANLLLQYEAEELEEQNRRLYESIRNKEE